MTILNHVADVGSALTSSGPVSAILVEVNALLRLWRLVIIIATVEGIATVGTVGLGRLLVRVALAGGDAHIAIVARLVNARVATVLGGVDALSVLYTVRLVNVKSVSLARKLAVSVHVLSVGIALASGGALMTGAIVVLAVLEEGRNLAVVAAVVRVAPVVTDGLHVGAALGVMTVTGGNPNGAHEMRIGAIPGTALIVDGAGTRKVTVLEHVSGVGVTLALSRPVHALSIEVLTCFAGVWGS